jgi:ketosteroid isomerase-like protein
MAEKVPVELVLAFLERINHGDVEGLCALLTDDHVFIDALGSKIQGRENMRQAWKRYFGMIPDYRVSHEEILQRGNIVGVFGTARGTYAPDGRLNKKNCWEIPGAWKAMVRDGRIAEWRVYADNQPVRHLMGEATP